MIINFIEIPLPFNFDETCNFIQNALTDVIIIGIYFINMLDGWMDRWLGAEWMDGWMDGWMDRWMDGWTDKQTDVFTNIII